MAGYYQVNSARAYPKKGKASKQAKTDRQIKAVTNSLYDAADIGVIPPSERTSNINQYAKMPKDRNKQGRGDMMAEIRTDSYAYGTYLRTK